MIDYSVIITASLIPSYPDIRYIQNVINSLKLCNIDINKVNIILSHDALNKNDITNVKCINKYNKYLENLKEYYKNYSNIKIINLSKHGHLTGNIRNALQYINTKYILIIQHDLSFRKEFDINKIIEDMEKNKELKHIRFNKRRNIKHKWDSNDLFGYVLKSKNYNYTRTGAWSDINHLTRTDYYKNIIMNECKDGTSMEWNFRDKINNKSDHEKYGTYLFGDTSNKRMIKNLDGRRNKN